jgi:outer membrane protein OmpA-like peptidoglycan-associated protein
MKRLKYLPLCLAILANPLHAEVDKEGASDHSLLSRYTGFHIEATSEADFDQARMIAAAMVNSDVKLMDVAGQISNIRYGAEDGTISAFQIISNYKSALDQLDAEIIFFCSNATECGGENWQYGLETRDLDLFFKGLDIFFFEQFGIVVAQVEQDGQTAHIMVVATAMEGGNTRRVYQSIVTSGEMESDKIGIGTIEDVTAEIAEAGTVVLDGVLFDFDTADLTDTSNETLDTVTQYLTAHPDQSFYVVGHTDSVGTYEYNFSLSQNRARSVIAALASRGVLVERLTGIGVGPAAPVANNESEAGKALNRRVELVVRP